MIKNQWTEDYKLLDWGPRGLFPEYLEMSEFSISFHFGTCVFVYKLLVILYSLRNAFSLEFIYIINYMEQNPTSETNSYSTGQKFLTFM